MKSPPPLLRRGLLFISILSPTRGAHILQMGLLPHSAKEMLYADIHK